MPLLAIAPQTDPAEPDRARAPIGPIGLERLHFTLAGLFFSSSSESPTSVLVSEPKANLPGALCRTSVASSTTLGRPGFQDGTKAGASAEKSL